MNRALIVKSFFPSLAIQGQSDCEDVKHMQNLVEKLLKSNSKQFNCGEGGTSLRFFLSRLCREHGEFRLKASPRLLQRPQQNLFSALQSMGAKIERIAEDELLVVASGWNTLQSVDLPIEFSSQYISSLLLSAWKLPEDLNIFTGPRSKGSSYLEMTIDFLNNLGMEIQVSETSIRVPARQQLKRFQIDVEPDLTSVFSLACFALIKGQMTVSNFPIESIQPDRNSLKLFKELGAEFSKNKNTLKIESSKNLKPISVNLNANPDLFPVLAVLLSRVAGVSVLSGLDVLKHKESDRFANTVELLKRLAIEVKPGDFSLEIYGKTDHCYPQEFKFDPDQDHRMAMAAALAVYQGADIEIQDRDVVNKSFPEFWQLVGL